MAWKERAQLRRKQQLDSIPEKWRIQIPAEFTHQDVKSQVQKLLTDQEWEITQTTDAGKILTNIKNHEWKAEEVTVAYCKRAAIAQQMLRCCTEVMFQDAISQAKALDQHYSQTGELIGPLHGIPLSLKDSHDIKGYDTTLGWVGLIGKPAKEDALSVQEYRKMGAIIYCKTNIPQSLMMSDSYNHVFGQSVNAFNQNLISGGSSGGEAALIGSHGSILGIGTDIGGSIRIPAALQGLYGLCPTIGRVFNRESGRTQKYVVPPVAGPMATSLSSIDLFMESYLSTSPWTKDPYIYPIPWVNESTKPPNRKLKLAYILDDGVILPQPPIQRAVRDLADRLKRNGHEVIEWDATSHNKAYYNLWLKAVLADGGRRFENLCNLANEPLIPGMLVGTPETELNNGQRQELAEEIWDYQKSYLQKWNDSEIDAIIMPVTPWVGMKPKTWVKSQQYCGYTAIWNLLNYTALAFPATVVSSELDQPNKSWNDHKGRSFSDQFNHDQYDVDLVRDMPVGLQIVTGRFGEEKAIAIAKVIESL